jgi:hypothetical protein
LERFLERYVDRAASEDRGDEELMLLRAGAECNDLNAWEWEAAKTLSHIVDRGLDVPRRAFTVYLKSRDSRCDGATLTFTTDDLVVFGVSVDDSRDDASEVALILLHELAELFGAIDGVVLAEEPPPLTPRDTLNYRRILHRWPNDT